MCFDDVHFSYVEVQRSKLTRLAMKSTSGDVAYAGGISLGWQPPASLAVGS